MIPEREREALMRLTMCAREECIMCKYHKECDFDFQCELATKNMNILADALRKTENSSEKPNNCEHITEDGVTCAKYPACDDCLDNPLNKVKGSERLVKGSEQTDLVEDSPSLVKDLVKAFGEDGTWLERQGVYTLTLAEAKQRAVDIIESVLAKDEPTTQMKTQNLNLTFKTLEYCDICDHKGCKECIANALDEHCIPSQFKKQIEDECAKEYEELGLKELKELIEVDRKTENSSEKPNNCEWSVEYAKEMLNTMPCEECGHWEHGAGDHYYCALLAMRQECCFESKGESTLMFANIPQTERSE